MDVVIMKNSATQEEEKKDIFNWKVEYDVKTGRRIYSCRDETTQKRKRSWYSPYADKTRRGSRLARDFTKLKSSCRVR